MRIFAYSKPGETNTSNKIKLRFFFQQGKNEKLSEGLIKKNNYQEHVLYIYPLDLNCLFNRADINAFRTKKVIINLPIADFQKSQMDEENIFTQAYNRTQMAANLFPKPSYKINGRDCLVITRELDFSILDQEQSSKLSKQAYFSLSSHPGSTVIIIDPDSRLLDNCYKTLTRLLTSKAAENNVIKLLQEVDNNLLRIFKESNVTPVELKALVTSAAKGNSTLKDISNNEHPVIPLEWFVEQGKGFCRQRALLAAYLIGRLVQDKTLPKGRVYYRRGNLFDEQGKIKAAHAWVCYDFIDIKGQREFLIYDPMWSASLTSKQDLTPSNRYPLSLYCLADYVYAVKRYGQLTIRQLEPLDVQKRLVEKIRVILSGDTETKANIIKAFKALVVLDAHYQKQVFDDTTPAIPSLIRAKPITQLPYSSSIASTSRFHKTQTISLQERVVAKMLQLLFDNPSDEELRLLGEVKKFLSLDMQKLYEDKVRQNLASAGVGLVEGLPATLSY